VSDRRKVKGALAAIHPTGRRRLSFREVVNSGRPAVYRQFGDSLLFVDGTLFDVLKPGSPIELGLKVPLEDPHFVRRAVGIEYGWRHALDCSCDACLLLGSH
jgi:hypothetical protein